jgi:RimJ/RimL family protein N-acetyltransferase
LRLEDGEVALRPFTEDDIPALVAALDDDREIDRWTRIPMPYTEEDAREFLTTTAEKPFAIVAYETGELLGGIGARVLDEGVVDVGYWVKREARGRGIASAALSLIARWAFRELGAGRVQLVTEPENRTSQRVAEKAGFTREGVLRSYLGFKGRRRDAVMFSLLRHDLDSQ